MRPRTWVLAVLIASAWLGARASAQSPRSASLAGTYSVGDRLSLELRDSGAYRAYQPSWCALGSRTEEGRWRHSGSTLLFQPLNEADAAHPLIRAATYSRKFGKVRIELVDLDVRTLDKDGMSKYAISRRRGSVSQAR